MQHSEIAQPAPVRLLSIHEVRELTGLSKSTIQKGTGQGWFPPPRKIGQRCVRWVSAEITGWIETLPAVNYTAPGREAS